MVARDDLNASMMRKLRDEVRALRTKVHGGFSSITRGALRIASEEGLIVQGSALIVGWLNVVGRLRVIGLGILEVSSLIDLLGSMKVRGGGTVDVEAGGAIVVGNVRIEDGQITVGGTAIVIDGATGKINVGGTAIVIDGTTGKISVGGNQIVIDGTTAKITVNGMVIDPADGGSITFPGGARLRADVGNGVQLQMGGTKVSVQDAYIQMTIGTKSLIINSSGHRMSGMDTISIGSAPPGAFLNAVVANSSGDLSRVVP